MITSMMGRMADAEKLSIPQLQMAIKNGTIPAYVGVPLLQDKVKQHQQAMAMQQAQQQQGQQAPIADQVMQEADQYRGIDELPTNLPTEEDERAVDDEYANGGIIAFADTGAVRDPARRSLSQDNIVTQLNDRMGFQPYAGRTIYGRPEDVPKEISTQDILKTIDAQNPTDYEYTAAQGAKNLVESVKEDKAANRRAADAELERIIAERNREAARVAAADTPQEPTLYRGSLTEGLTPAGIAASEAQLPKGITALAGASLPVGSEKLTPRVGTENAPSTLKEAEAIAGKSPAAAQAVSATDRYMAMLEKSGESVGREKKEALYMALITGGLTAAGGTSPNALANIAAGMVPATQQYQKAIADIRKDDRERIEKLMTAGISKEKLALELRKLGIEDKKVNALVNYYNARAGAAGSGGSAAADKLSLLEQKQLEAMELKARQEVRTATTAMNKDLANNTTYQMNLRLANTSKDPKQRAEALATVNSIKQPYLDLINDAREYANVYSTRRRDTTGETDTSGSSGNITLPKGIPTGSRLAGKSGGKDVYEAPDGKRYIVD